MIILHSLSTPTLTAHASCVYSMEDREAVNRMYYNGFEFYIKYIGTESSTNTLLCCVTTKQSETDKHAAQILVDIKSNTIKQDLNLEFENFNDFILFYKMQVFGKYTNHSIKFYYVDDKTSLANTHYPTYYNKITPLNI